MRMLARSSALRNKFHCGFVVAAAALGSAWVVAGCDAIPAAGCVADCVKGCVVGLNNDAGRGLSRYQTPLRRRTLR